MNDERVTRCSSDEEWVAQVAEASNRASKTATVVEEDLDTRADVLFVRATSDLDKAKAEFNKQMAEVRRLRQLAAVARGESIETAVDAVQDAAPKRRG